LSTQRPPRPYNARSNAARRADSTPDINENSVQSAVSLPLLPARASESSISTGDILDIDLNFNGGSRLATPSPQPHSFYVLPEVGDHPPPLPPRTSDQQLAVVNGNRESVNPFQRRLPLSAKKEKPQPPLPIDSN
uniref:Uncharacterized protein n=1 Tax=Plectus sambesii TaxID=2011161 RepID=A0A914VF75_9BILA